MTDILESILTDKKITDIFKKGERMIDCFDFDKKNNVLISNIFNEKDNKVSYIIQKAKERNLKDGCYKVEAKNIMKANNGKNYYTINCRIIKKIDQVFI